MQTQTQSHGPRGRDDLWFTLPYTNGPKGPTVGIADLSSRVTLGTPFETPTYLHDQKWSDRSHWRRVEDLRFDIRVSLRTIPLVGRIKLSVVLKRILYS